VNKSVILTLEFSLHKMIRRSDWVEAEFFPRVVAISHGSALWTKYWKQIKKFFGEN